MAEREGEKRHFHCPYCDEEIFNMNLPWCTACHVEILHCPSCHAPVEKGYRACPECGEVIVVTKKEEE